MFKVLIPLVGVIITLASNSFKWEIIGLCLIIIPLIIPKKKKTFRKLR